MKLPVVLGLVVVACSPPRTERIERPHPIPHAKKAPVQTYQAAPSVSDVNVAAPEITVDLVALEPDPTSEIRWPLGLADHPELAPRFDIAKVLAEPGLDWMGLCRIGAYRRTSPRIADQLLYLRAWCAVSTHDNEAALTALARLRTSVVPGLASAVRTDLANVLVSTRDENTARALVTKFGLSGETDVLDVLAATYNEIGQPGSATEINELALTNDPGTSPAKTCQRLARRVLLAPETYRVSKSAYSTTPPPRIHDNHNPISTLFGSKLNADPQCRELDAQLSCWLVKSNCAAYYKLSGIAESDAFLVDARAAWPIGYDRWNADKWMRIVVPAMNARPVAVAYLYTVIALETALKVSPCDETWRQTQIETLAFELRVDSKLPSELYPRVERLEKQSNSLCWRTD